MIEILSIPAPSPFILTGVALRMDDASKSVKSGPDFPYLFFLVTIPLTWSNGSSQSLFE